MDYCKNDHAEVKHSHPMRNFVHFLIQEVVTGVEMLLAEHALPNQFVGHLAFHIHHQFQHFVVGFAGEHDLARIEFEQRNAHRPQIDGVVVAHAQNCNRD